MNSQLAVLDLFLHELGQDTAIHSKEDRLRLQKSVYLGQLSGVDLGYRYSWYVHGPYSPPLTQDYYALASLPDSEKQQHQAQQLNDVSKRKLDTVKPLFNIPADVDLALANWLELLSSWHYLRKVNGYDEATAKQKLQTEKLHVFHYADRADAVLKQAHIIN